MTNDQKKDCVDEQANLAHEIEEAEIEYQEIAYEQSIKLQKTVDNGLVKVYDRGCEGNEVK